jgi:hypothetical protein
MCCLPLPSHACPPFLSSNRITIITREDPNCYSGLNVSIEHSPALKRHSAFICGAILPGRLWLQQATKFTDCCTGIPMMISYLAPRTSQLLGRTSRFTQLMEFGPDINSFTQNSHYHRLRYQITRKASVLARKKWPLLGTHSVPCQKSRFSGKCMSGCICRRQACGSFH